MSDTPRVTLQDLQRLLDCFNRHDVDGLLESIAEDGVFETPQGPSAIGRRLEGHAQIRAHWTRTFESVPDLHFSDAEHWISADGERGASEWMLGGTNPDGTPLRVRGCDLFHFRGNKIVRKDSYLKQVQAE